MALRGLASGIWILIGFWVFAPCLTASESLDNLQSEVPDIFVSADKGEKGDFAVLVEKDKQRLTVFECNGTIKKVYTTKCSTGEVDGPKTASGDKKTPEGIYFFVNEYEEKFLSPIYGTRAFPIDYPNLLDSIYGHSGSAIWLHGTNKALKERDTNGCIALENGDIDKVARYIALNRTPIIIVDKLAYESPLKKEAQKKTVYEFVAGWNRALEKNDPQGYLNFYDSDYHPDVSWWQAWSEASGTLKKEDPAFRVLPKRTMIFKHKSIYLAVFDQILKGMEVEEYAGTRKLFISADTGNLKIVGDKFLQGPFAGREGEDPPLVRAALDMSRNMSIHQEVNQLVDGWIKAWSGKDIDTYGSCYASDFRSNGMDLKGWLRYKQGLNARYDYIRVEKENLTIEPGEHRSIAKFFQRYESSGFKAVGFKKLILIREDGKWKIYREIWSDIE